MVNINGSFAFGMNDLRLSLINSSNGSACAATRVQWLFQGPIVTEDITVATPPTWSSHDVPCPDGGGACGVEWRAQNAGVLPDDELPGFGLKYNPLNLPYPKSWVIDIGEGQIEMPIATLRSGLRSLPE